MLTKHTHNIRLIKNILNYSTIANENVQAKKEMYYKKQSSNTPTAIDNDWETAKPYSSIPGPKPFPLLGNTVRFALLEFKDKPIDVVYKMLRDTYGNIVSLRKLIGHSDKVFIFSPDDIEKLFRNEGVWPVRDALHSLKYYRTVVRKDIFQDTPGLTSLQGEEWFKFRTVVNPILMQPKRTKEYIYKIDLVANDLIKNIDSLYLKNPEMPDNFETLINKWAFESIINLSLDKRMGCLNENLSDEAAKLIDSTLTVFKLMYKLDVLPSIWKYINTKDMQLFVESLDYLTFTFLKYINEAMANQKHDESIDKSIFERFLAIDTKVAITMVIDMMIAGVDTTSKTFAACLYFLSKNKRAQEALRQELITLMPSKDTPITEEILNNAKYLKAVIKETTRIAPIGVGTMRSIKNDIVLGGYKIPKDVDVIAGNILISNSDEFFIKSEEFMPERYLRSNNDESSIKNVNPFVSLPFGFGPRSCIGKRLANLEMEVAVAKVIRNYDLNWYQEDMKFTTTLIYGIADPLKVHVTPIDK